MLSDIALGFLKRQQSEGDRERKEKYERGKSLLSGGTEFLKQNLAGLREEAKPIAMQNLQRLMMADPSTMDEKKIRKLIGESTSFLWEGLTPPRQQEQTIEGSIPQQGGAELDISQTFQPLAPPEGYRQSAFPSQREKENQAWVAKQAQLEQDLQSKLRLKRGEAEIDQEFASAPSLKPPEPFTLSAGQRRFGPNGEMIAEVPGSERSGNIDPLSSEGIAARLAFEQGKPQGAASGRNIDPLSPEGIAARLQFERGRPVRPTGTPGTGASAVPGELSGLAKMALADPSIIRTLTPTQRGSLLEELGKANISPITLNRTFVDKSMEAITALKKMPGKAGAVGAKGPMSLFGLKDQPFAGTAAADFVANFDNLMSMIALPNLELMRGLGAMSDREFNNIAASASALKRDMSEQAFDVELEKLAQSLKVVSDRMKLVPAYTGGPLPPPGGRGNSAPAGGERKVKMPSGSVEVFDASGKHIRTEAGK